MKFLKLDKNLLNLIYFFDQLNGKAQIKEEISIIDKNSIIQNLKNLTNLTITLNKTKYMIDSIKQETFLNLVNLNKLCLNLNLNKLTQNSFHNLINISELSLKYCNIKEIDDNSFNGLIFF